MRVDTDVSVEKTKGDSAGLSLYSLYVVTHSCIRYTNLAAAVRCTKCNKPANQRMPLCIVVRTAAVCEGLSGGVK